MFSISDILHRGRRHVWPLLLVAVIMAVATDAAAQQARSADRSSATHTLVIRDGTVWVDGEPLAADELPPGLDLRGVELRLQHGGGRSASFELGGSTYALEEGRLVLVEQPAQQAEVDVFFRQGDEAIPASEAIRRVQPTGSALSAGVASFGGAAYAHGGLSAEMLRQTQALEAQVRELATSDVERLRQGQLERQMMVLQRQAASMVEAASRLPQDEVRSYLDALRRQDAALFQQIQREWDLEASTVQLAAEIRRSRDADRRARLSEELRLRLDRVFELKQENRRREIEQLERELATLQERLAERERLREQIVQRRVEELTGSDGQ